MVLVVPLYMIFHAHAERLPGWHKQQNADTTDNFLLQSTSAGTIKNMSERTMGAKQKEWVVEEEEVQQAKNEQALVESSQINSKDGVERHNRVYHEELHGHLLREPAAPLIPSLNFPSNNFEVAVVDKDPKKDEPFSPNTQHIVESKAGYNQQLPTDSEARQKELVRLYTKETPLYHEMNKALRDDNGYKMEYFGAYIKELRAVFKTDHVDQIIDPFEGTVWRGITLPDVEAALQVYQEGKLFVWPAFTSMSTNEKIAMGFGNIVFEIFCHPPSGLYDDANPEYVPASIQKWSVYSKEEEILFPPNVKFRVAAIKKPDASKGLSKPVIVCETVGFDTDDGIVDFIEDKHE